MKRKLLSILLTLCLAFSLLPTAALADGEGTQTNDVAQIGGTGYAEKRRYDCFEEIHFGN